MYYATNPSPAPRYAGSPVFARGFLQARPSASRSLSGMGDDAAILASVFAGQSGAPASTLVQQTVQQAMSQGSLWTKENCAGIPASSNMLGSSLSAGGAVTMKIAGLTGPAAPVVLVAGAVMQLFGALFAHHSQKVVQEQQIICAVVAACNDTFTSIDQLVQSSQITPDQASQALDGMYSQLTQNVQPILKQDSGQCNAACFILAEARGVIAKKKAAYAAILPPQASAACAQEYWKRYADVAASSTFGPAAGPQGAWTHYSNWGIHDGHNWPCDTAGNIIPQATPAATPAPGAVTASVAASDPFTAVTSLVSQAAASTGIPSWAILGVGALLLMKVIE